MMASSRISGPRLWPGLRNAAGVLRAAACGFAAQSNSVFILSGEAG